MTLALFAVVAAWRQGRRTARCRWWRWWLPVYVGAAIHVTAENVLLRCSQHGEEGSHKKSWRTVPLQLMGHHHKSPGLSPTGHNYWKTQNAAQLWPSMPETLFDVLNPTTRTQNPDILFYTCNYIPTKKNNPHMVVSVNRWTLT